MTCLLFEKGSERVCLLELVDPTRLEMDPSNLWESWAWWIAMDKARRCNISSSPSSFLWERLTLLLLDPSPPPPLLLMATSFFFIHITLLPIFQKNLSQKSTTSVSLTFIPRREVIKFPKKTALIFLFFSFLLKIGFLMSIESSKVTRKDLRERERNKKEKKSGWRKESVINLHAKRRFKFKIKQPKFINFASYLCVDISGTCYIACLNTILTFFFLLSLVSFDKKLCFSWDIWKSIIF